MIVAQSKSASTHLCVGQAAVHVANLSIEMRSCVVRRCSGFYPKCGHKAVDNHDELSAKPHPAWLGTLCSLSKHLSVGGEKQFGATLTCTAG